MAMVTFPVAMTVRTTEFSALNAIAIDAAGESNFVIGRISIPGGGSKTISAAGAGKIYVDVASLTFANVGTTARIGVQDVAATGLEDGTFDVYADFVGGGGGIVAGMRMHTMLTGTKTIADGDLIAIGIELTARAGADTISVNGFDTTLNYLSNFPYSTRDSGAGPTKNANMPRMYIVFDDGTIGSVLPPALTLGVQTETAQTYASNSTPNEYGGSFDLTARTLLNGVGFPLANAAVGDNFDVVIYQNPFSGSPSVVYSSSIVAAQTANGTSVECTAFFYFPPITLEAGTYVVTLKPTTTNTITLGYYAAFSGNSNLKQLVPWFGTSINYVSRTTSGAFSVVQTYYIPILYLSILGVDDGSDGVATTPFNWTTAAANGANTTSVTTAGVTTVSGRLGVVFVGAFTNIIGATPITDNYGNTWTAAIASQGVTEGWGAIFYCEDMVGGAGHTFTFTPSSSGFISIAFVEIQGAELTGALGDTNYTTATATAHTTGDVTAGTTPEIAVSCYSISRAAEGGGTVAFPALMANSLTATAGRQGAAMAVRLLAPGETVNQTMTMGSSNPGFCGAATFKAAVAIAPAGGGEQAHVF